MSEKESWGRGEKIDRPVRPKSWGVFSRPLSFPLHPPPLQAAAGSSHRPPPKPGGGAMAPAGGACPQRSERMPPTCGVSGHPAGCARPPAWLLREFVFLLPLVLAILVANGPSILCCRAPRTNLPSLPFTAVLAPGCGRGRLGSTTRWRACSIWGVRGHQAVVSWREASQRQYTTFFTRPIRH